MIGELSKSAVRRGYDAILIDEFHRLAGVGRSPHVLALRENVEKILRDPALSALRDASVIRRAGHKAVPALETSEGAHFFWVESSVLQLLERVRYALTPATALPPWTSGQLAAVLRKLLADDDALNALDAAYDLGGSVAWDQALVSFSKKLIYPRRQ